MTALAGGAGPEIAAHAAGADQLVTVGPSGGSHGTGITLAAGTSPAIAAAPGGGFEIAFEAPRSDHLVTVTDAGTSRDTGITLADGTRPALAPVSGGGYQLAYINTGGDLATLTGTGPAIDTGIAVTTGTSPAAAAAPAAPGAQVKVPDVLSFDQGAAQDLFAAIGLPLGHIASDTRCIDVAGGVLVQDPIGGAVVPVGTPVSLTVSTGTDANGNPCVFK
jgi:hypothetical protein